MIQDCDWVTTLKHSILELLIQSGTVQRCIVQGSREIILPETTKDHSGELLPAQQEYSTS